MVPKFRVWSKTLGKYRQLDETSNDQGLGMLFEVKKGIGSNVTSICYSVGDVVEQFTGLTDMNGKEIYEGDILRLSRNEPKTYIYDDKDNLKSKIIMPKTVTETAPVTNDAGTFGVSVKGVFLTLREVDKGQQNIEVIGNIHTNHELLEEDK